MNICNLCVTLLLLPLSSAIIIGCFGKYLGKKIVTYISIISTAIAAIIILYVVYGVFFHKFLNTNITWYIWGAWYKTEFKLGFLLDNLSVIMLLMVITISLIVQVYSIDFMKKDPSYTRFFSYISFFTFSMLLLVIANNFLQLFFGWEFVGLASYLLINFWFNKNSANLAGLKAFFINRIGDFGFLLGIGTIFLYCNSLDYLTVFNNIPKDQAIINLICGLLFVGAMAKSAQIPLHVWLPDSMEGPTPVSALIHAATMVTAGVFMLVRVSPILEYSKYCLNIILAIGSITAFLLSLLAIVEQDIKRIMAYSTISQLGIMMVAIGVSGYSLAMMHLLNHAFFKTLLFLGIGSIILATNQDNLFNFTPQLKKYLPVTYWCMLIASLTMVGVPGFSAFFSKDLIIQFLKLSKLPFAVQAYYLVIATQAITAFYSFRLMFAVFNKPIVDIEACSSVKSGDHEWRESKIIVVPLIILAIFSVILGGILLYPVINNKLFATSTIVLPTNNMIKYLLANKVFGIFMMLFKGFINLSGLVTFMGIMGAFLLYVKIPSLANNCLNILKTNFLFLYKLLQHKYLFNEFNQLIIRLVTMISRFFAEIIDQLIINQGIVVSISKTMVSIANVIQKLQTGNLYTYIYFMLTGVLVILLWLICNIS